MTADPALTQRAEAMLAELAASERATSGVAGRATSRQARVGITVGGVVLVALLLLGALAGAGALL